MVIDEVAADLQRALSASGQRLAPAALVIGQLEHPRLDPRPYLQQLDDFGREASRRVRLLEAPRDQLAALNSYLFGTLGFAGNKEQYLDPRNSFLNEVIERRVGIPISLAIVYIEVGRRAGLQMQGIAFPGHFLVRCDTTGAPGARGGAGAPGFEVVDPFNGGALLSEFDCVTLLREHAGEDAVWDARFLDPADRRAIVLRMLNNLKRAYVALRSFDHARRVSDLLLAVEPSGTTELRDRGLLSYHLHDFSSALRDLEAYLRAIARDEPPQFASADEEEEEDEAREEGKAIWEHVKNLRRRVASFN